MSVQRVLSGLVLFLIAAAGVVLIRPDLFPDITVPRALMEAPRERTLLGVLLGAVAALVLAGLALSGRRAGRERNAPLYGGPDLSESLASAPGAADTPTPEVEPEPEASEEPRWAALPPLQLADTPPEAGQVEESLAEPEREPEPEPEPVLVEQAPMTTPLVDAADDRGDDPLAMDEAAVEEARAAASEAPEDTAKGFELVKALGRLAERHETQGQVSRARALYLEAAEVAERLTAREPDSQVLREALFNARLRRQALEMATEPTPA